MDTEIRENISITDETGFGLVVFNRRDNFALLLLSFIDPHSFMHYTRFIPIFFRTICLLVIIAINLRL